MKILETLSQFWKACSLCLLLSDVENIEMRHTNIHTLTQRQMDIIRQSVHKKQCAQIKLEYTRRIMLLICINKQMHIENEWKENRYVKLEPLRISFDDDVPTVLTASIPLVRLKRNFSGKSYHFFAMPSQKHPYRLNTLSNKNISERNKRIQYSVCWCLTFTSTVFCLCAFSVPNWVNNMLFDGIGNIVLLFFRLLLFQHRSLTFRSVFFFLLLFYFISFI